ncbi:MAG: hypothetical protein K8R11_07425 [Methanococcoides sp.]|nr:hypothetical protein [Methanococcoides sp.]
MFLGCHYTHYYGISATGKSAGEVDIKIEDGKGNAISICEAFILKSLNRTVIDLHVTKIFGYDSNGLTPNFILVYAESQDFINLWTKYLEYIPDISFDYQLVEGIKDVSEQHSECTDIKVALAKHERNGSFVDVYHIFVKMNT